jgi:hypothetical protein
VSKQIVTSQSFIGKKLNKSTSFDIDKAADTIAEELISKKIQKNVREQQYEGLIYGETNGKLFLVTKRDTLVPVIRD